MLTAVVAHPPLFGAKVKSFDAAKAKAVRGVRGRRPDSERRRGARDELLVGEAGTRRAHRRSGTRRGANKLGSRRDSWRSTRRSRRSRGWSRARTATSTRRFAGAAKTLEASFEFPYLAHAAMEPMNCVIQLEGRTAAKCGTASSSRPSTRRTSRAAVGPEAGAGEDQHALCRRQLRPARESAVGLSGGSGAHRQGDQRQSAGQAAVDARGRHARRLLPSDVLPHAARRTRRAPARSSRGSIASSASRSSPARRSKPMMVKDGVDAHVGRGRVQPALRDSQHAGRSAHRRRSACRCCGGARSARRTRRSRPRRSSTSSPPRRARTRSSSAARCSRSIRATSACSNLAAEKAGWGNAAAAERAGARGIARARIVQHLRRAGRRGDGAPDGTFKVDRVVCAVDCGVAVNPDVIRAQMEGGIGFGLSAALHGAITLKDGRVEQSNFHDYRCCASTRCRRSRCTSCRRREAPTGVGEPGVPPIAPALAMRCLPPTGKRIRTLPIRSRRSA